MVQPGSEATYNKDRTIRYASARLQELMAATAGLIGGREFIVETGEPAEAIVKVAAVTGAGLVVLGVRAPATLSDRLGWSTAYGVVQQAHCPVLTARHSHPQQGFMGCTGTTQTPLAVKTSGALKPATAR